MKNLTDPMGRPISYLRVSLTHRCNLRCSYCYGSATANSDKDSWLSLPNILRLIKVFAALGITKVRFTGGEPLLRSGIVDLIGQTSALNSISSIGLTTNGLILQSIMPELAAAGLNCLNISLDTLNRAVFRKITGVDGFERVHSAIVSAEKSKNIDWVKVNTVVMRGVNDGEIRRFAFWALQRRIELRFIEFMPTRGSGWVEDLFVGEDEIKSRIGLDLKQTPVASDSPGPATCYGLPGAPGRIGFISAVSRCFCAGCNRLRMTSTGDLLGCLFLNKGLDLKPVLADGANTDEIADHIRNIVAAPGFRRLPDETSIPGFNPFMRKVGG